MHVIRLLLILSVLKSVASQLSIKKRGNLQNNFTNKFIDFMVVYIYIICKIARDCFQIKKNINSILLVLVQSSLDYWQCRKCLLFRA